MYLSLSKALEALLPRGARDALVALALGVAALLIWLHATGPGAGAGYDFFTAYLRAARAVALGENPYHQLARLTLDSAAGELRGNGYVYPPLLAVLLSFPVRLGGNELACWLFWNALNVVAVLWMGYELNLALRSNRSLTGTMGFAVASLALGAAVAIKPTMALVILVWLWKGDWGMCLRAMLISLALVLVPFALIGPESIRDYVTFLVHWNAFGANADFINQTPYAFLLRAFTVNPATRPLLVAPFLVWPLRLATIAGAVLLWLRATPRPRLTPLLDMSAFLLALPLILLLSPLAEDIHFTLLAPALSGLSWVAWIHYQENRAAAWTLWVAFLFSCLPRMQELIYPSHLLILPGQSDPHLGPLITLLRTSALLALAVATLVAGQSMLRAVNKWAKEAPQSSLSEDLIYPPGVCYNGVSNQ
jgi:hypothetical protein